MAPLQGNATDAAKAIAASLLSGERKAILLGNAAAHHPASTALRLRANWIGEMTGATVGFLTEAANTVGAQLVKASAGRGRPERRPDAGGRPQGAVPAEQRARVRLRRGRQGAHARPVLRHGDHEPFKANPDISDVLLPIAPWTETPGTFVNAEGRVQASMPWSSRWARRVPPGRCCACWATCWACRTSYESASEVLADARGAADAQQPLVQGDLLSNKTSKAAWLATPTPSRRRFHLPARFHRAPRGLAAAHGRCAPRNSRR